VPTTFDELIEIFVQEPVFAACFALLLMNWFFHYRFLRRFGFEDTPTQLLNALLLFLVLLYVYPLRFMASFLYNALILRRGDGGPGAMLSWEQSRTLMIVYSLGFALIYGVFGLMYAHAWRKRIELDSVERVLTESEIHGHLISAGVGMLSMSIAAIDARWVSWAGCSCFLMGPLHAVHGRLTRRAIERFRGKVPGAPPAS